MISHARTNRVGYLSPTCVGKTHDKKIADRENIAYPRKASLGKDTDFQGYEPLGVTTYQPKKSRTGKNCRPTTSGITALYPGSESELSMQLRGSNAHVV